MTVKELRAALGAYPEDAQVFLYNELDECDGLLDQISVDSPLLEHDDTTNDTFIYTPYYCQGDSEAEQYWHEAGVQPVVFLIATNNYHTFTHLRKENA